jgi:hypothetical protein
MLFQFHLVTEEVDAGPHYSFILLLQYWYVWTSSYTFKSQTDIHVHSFIPLPCAECNDSLPFSGASSFPLCYILFPATLLHQQFFYLPSLHLSIYFLVYLLVLLTDFNAQVIVRHSYTCNTKRCAEWYHKGSNPSQIAICHSVKWDLHAFGMVCITEW